MKKFLAIFLLITTFLPAQSFEGIKHFPPMTLFTLNRNYGRAYYVRLDESKSKTINTLGYFTLYDKYGHRVSQNIRCAVFDKEGNLWFVNKRGWWSTPALYKMNGAQFRKTPTQLHAEFIGNMTGDMGSWYLEDVTGLVFYEGKLYGLTSKRHAVFEIDTTNGNTHLVTYLNFSQYSTATIGLVKIGNEVYVITHPRHYYWWWSWYYYYGYGYSHVYKFSSFPSNNVSYIGNLSGYYWYRYYASQSFTGHPNGHIYFALTNGIGKFDVNDASHQRVLSWWWSNIGGMAFYIPNETGENVDENYADLSLTGSVDNPKPENGEEIHFTFTLKNAGPDKATNVVVKNTIQDGIDFISASAGTGEAKDSANIITWNVPELDVNAQTTLEITAKLNIQDANRSAFDLGPAKGYNVFVIQNADSLTSDTEGKMFVGNLAHLGPAYSVGYALRNDTLKQNVLVVGHTLIFGPGGAIYGGNVVFGADTVFNDFNPELDIVNGELIQDWNYPASIRKKTYLLNQLSGRLYKYTPNGKTTLDFSTLRLNGSDPFLNVFSVEEEQLENATDFIINVPNGSVVLVNFKDEYSEKDTMHWGGGLKVYGADYSNVLYNFYNTRYLHINGINVTGTILAPKTDINFADGQLNGQIIALNLNGHAQYNNIPFVGNLPYDTTLYSISEVISADQIDTNSTPNNGVVTEDDYASISVTYDTRAPQTGSGHTTFKWELVGSFKKDELVWTMEPEASGTFLIGTWGGNIYRSENDTTWILLNNGQMDEVDYIWAIMKKPNGKIFVGTERGVYISEDNGTTWKQTNFTEGDVRCLAYYKNEIYAGTWGNGLYKSTDDGITWHKVENSIPKASVVGLAVDKKGNLFIGTFDVGLYKSTDGGETVTQLDIEYPYIWTLGKSESGIIYAGTYGNGLYSSADEGATWGREFAVEANYIYAVRTQDNRIYATSWESGVYTGVIKTRSAKYQYPHVASGSTVDWYDMGLSGFGVSSILPDKSGKYVYAGTSRGEIYRSSTSITSVKKQSSLPHQFALKQNYPNPFGKVTKHASNITTIEYKIPKSTFVTLTVYDVLGRRIKTIVHQRMKAGTYKTSFNAENLPSGVYFYTLKADGFITTRKMLLIK